jgi:hypothetical protein
MSIYAVEIVHLVHTCPGDPEPHPVSTWRRIIHTTPGRPCLTPITVHCGNQTAAIPCGRHEPTERQCANCRTIITIHKVTIRHLNSEEPAA